MARTAGTISVGADTRQLERDIQNALSKDFRFKGFNERAFAQPLGRITGAANEFQKSLDASNARVIAFGASAGLIYTVEKAFTDLIKTTISVQKSLTDINVILDTSSEGLVKFGQRLFDIAKNTGQSFQTVAGAATELARQGLGVEETLKRASDALILTRLSGLDAVSAVEALTATINSFNKTALDSTTIINKLANVDAAFAVSSADLANALQRVGSSAQDVGVNFDELLAIVTSVQQTTARGGAVIGNSLKTIFTRIQRTDVLDQLQALGLNVRDLEGNTLPAIYILKQLGGTFDSLGDAQRSQIAELVGGVFQINVLKAALADLGKEYSIYDRALQTSATSTDEAIKRNEALNQTLSALFNSTLQNITQLGATIGGGALQPAIEGSLKNINKLLEVINSQDSESFGAKLGEGILKGLSTFISGPGIVLITAVIGKLLLDLTKFAASGAKALLGINQQATVRAQLQSKINEVLLKEPEILAAINAKQISVLDVERRILGILKEQNVLRTQAAALSNSISGGLISKGVSVSKGQITTKTKSQGFIPNFVMSEVYGALSGGYEPGKIKEMNISGEGRVIYNSAEKVKKFPGMSQPAIIPPKNSKAGKEYRKNFIAQNSFDPYASQGFIPNFNLAAIRSELPMNSIREQMMFRKYLRQGYEVLGGELYERAGLASNASLYSDKTLVRAGGQILVKSNKKALIVKQLREKELVTGKRRGEKEAAKIRSKLVYVYPDAAGGGSPFYVGGTSKAGDSYKFPAFPFPGGGKKVPDELYNNISNSLVQNAKDYISQVSTRPQLVDQKIFEQYVKSNLSRSAVEAATGQVFEASVKAAIKRVTTSEISNFDLDKGELLAISKRFKSAGPLKDFTAGDFKNSLSDSNLDSFADKIATKEGKTKAKKTKTKYKGFIPNFSPLKKAMDTEKALGGKPVLDYKDGIGFYVRDQKTQPNFGAVMRDHPEGMKNAIKNSKIAQGTMSQGFIPNLAKFLAPDLGPITSMGPEQAAQVKYSGVFAGPFIKQAESEFRQIAETLRDQKISLRKANEHVFELARKYGLSNTSVENMSMSLKNVGKTTSAFNAKVVQLERTASGIFGTGTKELQALANKPGERGQTANAALGRAQEARARNVQRYQNIGIGASIGVPIIAQTLAQAAPNNKNVQAAAEGLGTAASFAGAGALFGPMGAAIGGVIGVLVGLKKALGIVNDRTEEFAKKASLAANELARFSEDVQLFLSTRGQLQAIESGEIRASPEEIRRLRKNEAAALAKVYNASSPRQREQIKTALSSGDEDLLKEAFGRASIAKDSAKGIADFNQAIRNAEKESKLTTETFEENIVALGNLRTRSGETFADLIYKNENVMSSLNKYVLTADSFARVTEYAQKSVDEFGKSIEGSFSFDNYKAPDMFGFDNSMDLERKNQRSTQPPPIPFTDEEIGKKVKELKDLEDRIATDTARSAGQILPGLSPSVPPLATLSKEQEQASQNLKAVLKSRSELMGGQISRITGLSEDYQKSIAIEVLAREKAQENFKRFSDTLTTFVTDLAKNSEISQAEAKDINETISKVLNIPGDPQQKMAILVERLRDLGVEGEKLAQIVNNVVKFSFSSLSRSLQDLFQKRIGDETPEGQIIAGERKSATLDFLKNSKFEELFNDLSYKDTGIDKVLGKTVQDTIGKILSGTVDETKRKAEVEKFQKDFVSQLEDMTKAGVPLELALAKITTEAERTAISSSLTSNNLTELARTISNRAERENALNKYIEIEAKLRKEFKDDIDGLARATESAKIKLIAFADAASGKGFREDLNAKLLEASRLDILNNRFSGLDLNEMGKIGKVDYQNIVRTTGAETISSINQGIFDPATKQKLINQAIVEQEKMLAKIDSGQITTRDISNYRARNKTIQDSSQILIQSYDKVNQSLYTVNGQQQARIAIENQLRNLEEEYKDNLEALNRVAPQLVEKLVAIARVKEGSLFAEEYKAISEAERTARIREGKFKPTDPFEAFSDEMLYSSQDMARDANSIFTDTAKTMKSEFNNAFQSIIDGTGTVEDAFQSMGLNIARRVQQLTQEMATNALFNSLFSNIGGIPSLFKNPMGGGGGGLFGFAQGGVVSNNSVKRFSKGGKVSGGSGTKDDVPAMLSQGEYVIRKSAVSKYGEPFLRKLNQGGFLQFAEGGYANYNPPDTEIDQMMANAKVNPLIIKGKEAQGRIVTKEMVGQFQETINTLIKEQDLSFSDQNSTWNSFRDTFGGGLTAELGNIYTYNDDLFPTGGSNILDPRLSDLARTDPNNPQSKTIQDKRNRLIDYLAEAIGIYYDNRNNAIDTIRQNLEERDRINQINAENRARVDQMNKQARDAYNKQKRNAILGGLLNAGIIAGTGLLNMAGGVGGLFKSAGNFFGGLFGGSSSNRLPAPSARLSTQSKSSFAYSRPSNLSYGSSARLPVSSSSSRLSAPSARLSVPPSRDYSNASVSFWGRNAPFDRKGNTPIGNYNYGTFNRAEGGIIGFAKGGSTGKDDIPAMLMGGEYVMRKNTVDLYGKSFFDDLNAGKIRKFAEGGFVSDSNKSSPSSLPAETSNTMQGNISNNISISINIDRSGNTSETETSTSSGYSNGMNNQANAGLKSEKEAKDLSEKIKTEVVKIITEQQRPGGMLSSSVYRKIK